jgi:hypothetical protein
MQTVGIETYVAGDRITLRSPTSWLVECLCRAKVAQSDVAIGVEKYISWLYVSMNNISLVQRLEC